VFDGKAMAMKEFLLLMHDDVPSGPRGNEHDWETYFAALRAAEAFEGGSALGGGVCLAKARPAPELTRHLSGYIRIRAENLEAAKALVAGNPVYEAGGTVEVRELPRGR
jgi:hypothetical protein